MHIEWQKTERTGVFHILIDGEEWKTIHRSIFGIKPPTVLQRLPLSDLEEWFHKTELRGAKRFSLARLALKSQLSIELRLALQRVLVSERSINTVLNECERLGYLNDQEWIERFINQQYERKNGPRLIIAKLRAKGVKEEEIAAMQRNNPYLQSGTLQIQTLLQRRYCKEDLSDFRVRRKVFSALMRKGFNYQEISDSLENYTLS